MSAVISQDQGIAASNSTLHIANVTLNGSRPSVATIDLVDQLTKSLAFADMENRRFNVDDEQHGTCEWLLGTTQWQQWQDSLDSEDIPRLIWIKGKAGTGKSTILKFAAERGHIPEDDELVLMHFFNGRGTHLEKSVQGMYRTLLVQLLENLPNDSKLPNSISRMFPQGESDWQLGKLVTLFKAVLRLQGRRPVTCFVDALDECDDNQIRDMIKSLRSMIEGRERASNMFRICFASRYYPHVSVPQYFVLDLPIEGQSGHEADVSEYVRNTLIIRDPSLARLIHERVQAKAQGVFMWCNLVIATLNEKHDCGQLNNERDAERILNKLPGELAELYETVLGLDEHNSAARDPRTLTCLQFVLFAKQGLDPLELWHAIELGELLEGRATQEAVNDLPSSEDALLAILHISRGLVELRYSYMGANVVQLIHESVRDFLLKGSALARLMGNPGAQVSSFERLKNICLEAIYTREHLEDGLIRHTLNFALTYAEQALREGIDQSECLARIDDTWSLWQTAADRFISNFCASLGTCLSTRNAPNLTRAYCRQNLKCDPECISRLLWQSYRLVSDSLNQDTGRVLIEECCATHAQGPKKHLLMELARSVPRVEFRAMPPQTPWLAHLSNCSDTLATLVLIAMVPDSSVHVAELYDTAQTQDFAATLTVATRSFSANEIIPDFKEDALMWAVTVGHLKLVAQLLRDEAVNVNAKQGQFTALYLAVENEQQAVIDLLLTRADLDIHAPAFAGFTVLETIVARDNASLLDQLLEWDSAQRQINPDRPGLTSTDRYRESLLHRAVQDFRVSIIEVILRWTGSDLLHIHDTHGRTPYEKAVQISRDWVGEPRGRIHTPESRARVVALLASASEADHDPGSSDTGHGDC